jgi:hypothetical protein
MEDDGSSDKSEPEQPSICHIVVPTEGAHTVVTSPDFERHIGGFAAPLFVTTDAFTAVVWCDEEGIPKRLRENLGIRAVFKPTSPIYGTCVITGPADDDGHMTSVSPQVVALFDRHARDIAE